MVSQGRKRLKLQERRAIRRRLDEHRQAIGLTRAALRDRAGCGDTTVAQWLNSKDPATPDVVSCVSLAREEGISLDWLLLGEGPQIRETIPVSEELPNRLRAAVMKALGHENAGVNDEDPAGSLPSGGQLLRFLIDEMEKLAPPPFRPQGFPIKGWWRLRLIERDMRHGSHLSGIPPENIDAELDKLVMVRLYLRNLQSEFDKPRLEGAPEETKALPPQTW